MLIFMAYHSISLVGTIVDSLYSLMKSDCQNNLYSFIIKAFLDVIFPPVCWICENLLEADRKVQTLKFKVIEK